MGSSGAWRARGTATAIVGLVLIAIAFVLSVTQLHVVLDDEEASYKCGTLVAVRVYPDYKASDAGAAARINSACNIERGDRSHLVIGAGAFGGFLLVVAAVSTHLANKTELQEHEVRDHGLGAPVVSNP